MAGKKMKISAVNSLSTETDWQTEDDFRTLCQAKKIEADPKRMAKIKEHAKTVMMNAASIATDDEGEK